LSATQVRERLATEAGYFTRERPLRPAFAVRGFGHDTSLFSKLVLGCIETKVCSQIRILQQFSKIYKIV
jgi:hypothetical protein